jgi:hypothetical protein
MIQNNTEYEQAKERLITLKKYLADAEAIPRRYQSRRTGSRRVNVDYCRDTRLKIINLEKDIKEYEEKHNL